MTRLATSDILKLAAHVADTGGLPVCLGVDQTGDTWRLAVLPGEAKPYAVQIHLEWHEKGRTSHAWLEWEAFVHLIDAAGAFCALVGKQVAEMSEV